MRWVIGDIHGMARPLETLLDAIAARDSSARFLFVGDYVNRGPDSRGVVDRLLSLPPDRAAFCRGNHDDIFDLILNHHSFASGNDPVPVFAWFLAHGLDRTLDSYGIDEDAIDAMQARPSPKLLTDLVASIPETHRQFFSRLPLVLEEPDVFVIHAKWHIGDSDESPDLISPIMQQPRLKHRVLWERFAENELNRPKHWRRRGFFGHTPVINYEIGDEILPIIANQCVLLDTGAALSKAGRLTAMSVENSEVLQVDHFGTLLS